MTGFEHLLGSYDIGDECVMVLDSILNDREYQSLAPELVADRRAHHGKHCARAAE